MGLYHPVKHYCSYLALTGFFEGDVSALHMEVTPQNDCTAAVPKQMYFKNSLRGKWLQDFGAFFVVVEW